MAQETNQTQGPLLCSNGCGFYGNRRNNGMCSVCYKDSLQRQNNSGRSSESASSSISGLGESVCVQLTSQHEQNSVCSGFSSSGADAHTDGPTAVARSTLETQDGLREETTNKLLTVDENTSRGKRKLDETPQPSGSDVSEQTSDVPEQSKPKKNRCFTCRRKVGLTGFGCRCGHLFCSVHRYSDVHSCSFDYKADAAEKIRKENPVIVGEKIQKI